MRNTFLSFSLHTRLFFYTIFLSLFHVPTPPPLNHRFSSPSDHHFSTIHHHGCRKTQNSQFYMVVVLENNKLNCLSSNIIQFREFLKMRNLDPSPNLPWIFKIHFTLILLMFIGPPSNHTKNIKNKNKTLLVS